MVRDLGVKTVEQFKTIIKEGYKEIILTGVNVGDYGKNIKSSLYQLIGQLVSIDGKFRIRISSVEPNLINDDLLKLISESEKLKNS